MRVPCLACRHVRPHLCLIASLPHVVRTLIDFLTFYRHGESARGIGEPMMRLCLQVRGNVPRRGATPGSHGQADVGGRRWLIQPIESLRERGSGERQAGGGRGRAGGVGDASAGYGEAERRNAMMSVARHHLHSSVYTYYVFVHPQALPDLLAVHSREGGWAAQGLAGEGGKTGWGDGEEDEDGLLEGCAARSLERYLHVWQPAVATLASCCIETETPARTVSHGDGRVSSVYGMDHQVVAVHYEAVPVLFPYVLVGDGSGGWGTNRSGAEGGGFGRGSATGGDGRHWEDCER